MGAVPAAGIVGMKTPKAETTVSSPSPLDGSETTLYNNYGVDLTPFHGEKDQTKLGVALERAHDTRKFEIELYWKRATYFWAFNAVVFAGYFAMFNKGGVSADMLFVINCLGFVFSIGWYLANRGSKFWQLNWETHVDLLEDEVTGPLYKTILDRDQFKLSELAKPYAFSVSRLNTVLSAFVVGIWLFLGIRSVTGIFGWGEPFKGFNILVLTLLTLYCVRKLFTQGKSDLTDPKLIMKRRDVRVRMKEADDGVSGVTK